MGNCQALEPAAVVIQHPGGRVDRLYAPTTVGEVMKSNPGHHVALVTLCVAERRQTENAKAETVRFTRVRLLKPKDALLLGQAYRLVTSQEVTKALRARKNDKLNKAPSEVTNKQQQMNSSRDGQKLLQEATDAQRTHKGPKPERDCRQRSETPTVRARHWRPSLHSISESGS